MPRVQEIQLRHFYRWGYAFQLNISFDYDYRGRDPEGRWDLVGIKHLGSGQMVPEDSDTWAELLALLNSFDGFNRWLDQAFEDMYRGSTPVDDEMWEAQLDYEDSQRDIL